MIKFWTFQSDYTLDQLCKTGIYFPDFDKTCQYDDRKSAYDYILNIYQNRCNDNLIRGKRLKGLVFGLTSYLEENIETYEDYKNTIFDFAASGISNCFDNIYVLELWLPDDTLLLPIDFYRFCDLIYFTSEEPESKELNGIDLDVDITKHDLFLPNGANCKFELPQCHIPYIKRSQIKNIYPGVSFEYNPEKKLVYSKSAVGYYKNRLGILP